MCALSPLVDYGNHASGVCFISSKATKEDCCQGRITTTEVSEALLLERIPQQCW